MHWSVMDDPVLQMQSPDGDPDVCKMALRHLLLVLDLVACR